MCTGWEESPLHSAVWKQEENKYEYYWVADGWGPPDRTVRPTRLVPQVGKNKLQEFFAAPICLRFGAVTVAPRFGPEQVRKVALVTV